ncbi:hypothetical protein RUM44_004824 [Polyplax serrata]|uniref:RanBD1 domain-containing protein n=1 Tax=Polyplax serrata TaxID=468196 RepID=A0ABR1B4N1_POLSC
MAEQNCSSPSTPLIITPTADQPKSDENDSNSLLSSYDSTKKGTDSSSSGDEKASCNDQTPKSNVKSLFSDPIVTSSSDKTNRINDGTENSASGKSSSFLRPSILSSGFSSFSSNTESGKTGAQFSLQCPKLSFSATKFGNGSFSNMFASSVCSESSETPSSISEEGEKTNDKKGDEKPSKSILGMFGSNTSSNSQVSATTIMTVPNFVFGQNLHERVTDSTKPTNSNNATSAEVKSNGASEMLFTSVLSSKEVKQNLNSDSFCGSKETSSLIEDAARCQEARANKRKYEEVLVTTGEEDEENILQINVKLFAFDNGVWVERGRGILRLNDQKGDQHTSSRIVIRTLGNLRVVLNTKIWSKMSLNRASEKSARITAMDPNGQVKIFLIQTSLKDMSSLYSLLEERIKSCKDNDTLNNVSPEKKIALEKNEE